MNSTNAIMNCPYCNKRNRYIEPSYQWALNFRLGGHVGITKLYTPCINCDNVIFFTILYNGFETAVNVDPLV